MLLTHKRAKENALKKTSLWHKVHNIYKLTSIKNFNKN